MMGQINTLDRPRYTPNELASHHKAKADTAELRVVRKALQDAYYKACSDYDRAYYSIQAKELARLEAEDK